MIRNRKTSLLGATLVLAALMLASTVVVSHAIAAGSVQIDAVPLGGSVNTDAADADGSTGEPDAGQTRQPPQIGLTPPYAAQPGGMGWIEATIWIWRSVLINAL